MSCHMVRATGDLENGGTIEKPLKRSPPREAEVDELLVGPATRPAHARPSARRERVPRALPEQRACRVPRPRAHPVAGASRIRPSALGASMTRGRTRHGPEDSERAARTPGRRRDAHGNPYPRRPPLRPGHQACYRDHASRNGDRPARARITLIASNTTGRLTRRRSKARLPSRSIAESPIAPHSGVPAGRPVPSGKFLKNPRDRCVTSCLLAARIPAPCFSPFPDEKPRHAECCERVGPPESRDRV